MASLSRKYTFPVKQCMNSVDWMLESPGSWAGVTAAELCGPQECGRAGDDKVTLGARPAPYISQSEPGRPVLIVTQSHQPTRTLMMLSTVSRSSPPNCLLSCLLYSFVGTWLACLKYRGLRGQSDLYPHRAKGAVLKFIQ